MDWIFLIGTVAFAFSGYLVGVRKHLDLLGIVIAAVLTAVGGGTIRDVLIGQVPRVFFQNDHFYLIFATLAVAWFLRLHRKESRLLNRLFIVADSVGLIAFSIAGAQIGLTHNMSFFGVAIIGFVTAIGGGLVRDMLVNDIPFILHQDFYGTVALLVAGGVYWVDAAGWRNEFVIPALFLAGLSLRLIAHWRALTLPKIKPDRQDR